MKESSSQTNEKKDSTQISPKKTVSLLKRFLLGTILLYVAVTIYYLFVPAGYYTSTYSSYFKGPVRDLVCNFGYFKFQPPFIGGRGMQAQVMPEKRCIPIIPIFLFNNGKGVAFFLGY